MKKTQWHNVSGTFSIEIGYYDGAVRNTHNDKEIPLLMYYQDCDELIIDFLSSGHYDPGCWDYPPEGSDERELDECFLQKNGEKVKISPNLQQLLFEYFCCEIEQVEISGEHYV